MSPKNPLLTAGLTALGLFGFAPLGVADPAPPTPSGSEPSVAPSPSHAVLLLTNGRLYEGTLSDGGSHYFVHTKTGKLPIPKRDVEKLGRSVREIYDYLLQRVPPRDPDEHMRLARWCLEREMNAEAVAQLREVVELSPNHPQALAMLDKLGGTAEREMRRDPDVARTNAEVDTDNPEGLTPALLGQAQRELGISGPPQIPGLSKAMNVKRVGEFARLVEPVLQARCVKCHDERYEGAFQLVRYKSRSDRSADAFRSNLDSVLALIDMENPAKSELLSASLRAHGGGNHPKPIFKGSNDRQYQILATWVTSLRRTPAVIAAQPQPPANNAPRFGTSAPAATEAFAAGRAGQPQTTLPPLSPTPTAPGRFDPAGAGAANIPPPLPPGELPPGSEPTTMTPENPYPNNVRVTVHSGDKDHPGVAPGTSFPTPFAVTGARPTLEPVPGGGAMIAPPRPAAAPATGAPVGGGAGTGVGVNPVGAPTGLPALPQDAAAAAPTADRGSSTSKKSIKFDPALLEKALMNRYAPK